MEKVVQVKQSSTVPNPPNVVRKFSKDQNMKATFVLVTISLAVVLAGVGSGWVLAGGKSSVSTKSKTHSPGVEKKDNEMGLSDDKTFRDSAEGVLEDGGIDGEGTHHLIRPGGDSQNVYLTSTAIDLASFVGKKVQVWGETISARKAGWLMDVGKVKILE